MKKYRGLGCPHGGHWNRRHVLKTGLLASCYGVLRPHANAAPRRRSSVIVIGAGMAGLAAARELRERDFEVTVVEGRDRIGGRMWTDRSLGVPVDLGAAWIEEVDGNPTTELARKFGVPHALSDDESSLLYDVSGEKLSEAAVEEIMESAGELAEALEALSEELTIDISIEEGIRRVLEGERLSDFERRALNWFVASELEASAAAPASELSLLAEEDEGFAGDDHLVHGGYDRIAEGLARGTSVHFKQKVRRIDHGSRGVRLDTERDSFEADFAVVTLPLGVLRSGSVEFSPPLPDAKRAAIQGLKMGTANKVVLAFREAFWPREPHYFSYMSETAGEFPVFLNLVPFLDRPILSAYLAGHYALGMERQSDQKVAGEAMRILSALFGRSIAEPERVLVTRWSGDPFSRGSYSFIPVGGNGSSYDALAEPVGGRLFFAGEATHRRYPATVHGAYLSGLREASRIAGL
jgi:monoamine oxidase